MSMMRIIILIVAGGAALMAAMLVRNMSNTPVQITEFVETEPEAVVPISKVLVASGELPLGHRISPDDLRWQDWPEELISDTHFTEEFAPEAINDLSGGIVRTVIYDGEPILDQKIVQPGERGFMAAVLNEGMRAVAVEISVETAAGGFILPNDRVDVILSHLVEVTVGELITEQPMTKTILQNVRVLAIDQTFREFEGDNVVVGTTATLELRPNHAEILMLAEQMGDISLTLRGVSDLTAGDDGVRAMSLTDTARDVSGTVRIYRSGGVEQTTIGGTQ